MNPKLVKERTRTKAQRPDIVVAYENLLRQRAAERKHDTRIAHCDKSIEQRRSA